MASGSFSALQVDSVHIYSEPPVCPVLPRPFDDSGDEDGQGLCLLKLGPSERQTNTHAPMSQPGPSD